MAGEKVLVVDDVEIVCAAFERELGQEGYEVDSAQDGKEALKKTESKKYDIIFIDFIMPGMDGVQTCKAIKAVSPDSILVIMTGKIEKETNWKEMAFSDENGEVYTIDKDSVEKKIGKVYYLYKPFAEGEILKVIGKALAQR